MTLRDLMTSVKQLNKSVKNKILLCAAKDRPLHKLSFQRLTLRVLLGFITAIWIGFFPTYLFLLYMAKKSFFSYDFFTKGVFAEAIFVVFSAFLLVFISFGLYGFLVFFRMGVTRVAAGKSNGFRLLTWLFFAESLAFNISLFDQALKSGKISEFLWLNIIAVIFCSFLMSFSGHSFKHNAQNVIAPILFVFLTVVLPPWFINVTSQVVSIGLRQFNVGGGVTANILGLQGSDEDIKGRLLLLTPQNAYMSVDEKITVVPISSHTKVVVR